MKKRKLKQQLKDLRYELESWRTTYEKNTATIKELQEQLEAAERRADRRLQKLVAIAFPGTDDGKVNGRTPASIALDEVHNPNDRPGAAP